MRYNISYTVNITYYNSVILDIYEQKWKVLQHEHRRCQTKK